MPRKKGRKKRVTTKILIITALDAPDWVPEEFQRILSALPPDQFCEALTINYDTADLRMIEGSIPEWLLVYCPVVAQDWVVGELLFWLELHPEIHRHIIYEKSAAPLPAKPIRPSNPLGGSDETIRDFCLRFAPLKLPS